MQKHAYLIMAHHRFDLLKKLIIDLDDERNDIFLHVDKKAKGFNEQELQNSIGHANLICVSRMNVHWGGYSQIKCILHLLEQATSYGYHKYYHFMVGVEYPLKTQKQIYDFFDKHDGKEFIGFDNLDTQFNERVRYYHIFNECGRPWHKLSRRLNELRQKLVAFQEKRSVDLFSKSNIQFKKGNASWSITHDLANYIVSQKKFIKKYFKHSFCGDEIFIHTLVYNSNFWNNVYDQLDEYNSCVRMTTWKDPYNQYHLGDLDELLNSGRMFARKFDGYDGIELIDLITEKR